jgi:hypothetical protein
MGFRQAIRYACWKDMKPIKLSTTLRSAAIMAAEWEQRMGELTLQQ